MIMADMTNSVSPAASLVAITPSNSANISSTVRAIYVGVGGNITVVTTAGEVVLFTNVPQGAVLGPFNVVRVNSTGTAASALVGFV